ncbi:hypothetical protein, partial [Primorskyibacter flagellatus]
GVPLVHLCAAGEGGSTASAQNPQALSYRKYGFFMNFSISLYFQCVVLPKTSSICGVGAR